ncbi:MAG: hypothetical protein KAH22_02115 [Thiotrichaceae bacterium]|nr:hypothetical protein [Thiotrichaceae bacterium]
MLSTYLAPHRTLLTIMIGIPIFLWIDSPYGDAVLRGNGQLIATFLVFIAFVIAYFKSPHRVKTAMLIGVVVGLTGEYLFSQVMGMYHYRFGNIPLWVAFAHGLIFASVFRISHKPWIKQNEQGLQKVLLIFAITYSIFWLIWANDWFGFLCTLGFFVVLFTAKKSRLFFLIMFAIVCYIEQLGTATECWYWPSTLLGVAGGIPSGNPPTGIAIFYFIFDAIILWVYLNLLHPSLKVRYQRFKLMKQG